MATTERLGSRSRGLSRALARGLDWRLLLLWVVGMLLPTLLVAVPIWRTLAAALDAFPLSSELARRFDALAFEDLRGVFRHSQPAIAGSAALALLGAVVLSPLLTAAILATAASAEQIGATFLQRAVAWYGRSFRIWLLSLIPLAVVVGVWSVVSKAVAGYAERAQLESRVDLASRLAWLMTGVLAVLLHLSVEAGRAELAATPERRSVWSAWFRGMRKAVRRPLQTLALYLVPTLLSLFVAALFSVLRLHLTGSSPIGFCLALLVTQVSVACIGWGRASRLFGLTALFRSESFSSSVRSANSIRFPASPQ